MRRGATCGGTVLTAHFAELIAELIIELSRERTFTDTGRVGFGHTDNIFNVLRSDSGTCNSAAGTGIGAGNIRESTVIDIEPDTLSAFEKNALSSAIA